MKPNILGIAGVVVVVAIVAVLASFYLVQPQIREIKLETWEFGYNGPRGGPTIKMKVGETVKITLVNRGGVEHEFMIVKNAEEMLNEMKQVIEELKAEGLDKEEIEKNPELMEIHEKYIVEGVIIVDNKAVKDVKVERGETKEFLLRFNEPGTYTYICAELAATFPQTHADLGMYGTIIVEE